MKSLRALFLGSMLFSLCASLAQAKDYYENDSGLYWSVRGGLSQIRHSGLLGFPFIEGGDTSTNLDDIASHLEWRNLEMDYGFVVGGAVGIKLAYPERAADLRFELEASYRRNEDGQTNAEWTPTSDGQSPWGGGHVVGDVTGPIGVTSAMFNTLLDFHTPTRFVPYIGVGAGISRIDFDVALYDIARWWYGYPYPWVIDQTYYALSWQAIAGLGFQLSPGTLLTVEARHFRLAGDRYSYLVEDQELENFKFDDWSVGLRFTF